MNEQARKSTPYLRSARMERQRWLLDSAIRMIGVDWDQGRTRYLARPCGPDAEADFQRVRDRVRKFADIDREFCGAARRREAFADAAKEEGRRVSEREHAFVAAVLWGAAQWPLFGNTPLNLAYSQHKRACFERYIALAAHRIRRVEIPFSDRTLPALLHLPTIGAAPYACVIQVAGMDSFKEHLVAMYGDPYLERGMATVTFDGPGQGESLDRGLWITATNMIEAGRAVISWVAAQPELDAARIGLTGYSFGSFWATQIAGATGGLAACGVAMVAQEAGMAGEFERASPTFKSRFMFMAGIDDEDAFDAFAATLTLDGVGSAIRCPYLVVAGEEDDLSHIEATWELLDTISAPRRLVLYQGERHGIAGGPAASLGPNRDELVVEWFADRFAGAPLSDELLFVDTAGRVHRGPLDRPAPIADVLAGIAPRSGPVEASH